MQWRITAKYLLFIAVVLCSVIFGNALFGNKERVRLQDVSVLTLKDGHMTTGRRSSPVKQLQCVGGTAGCSAFRPQVVQCYNRGSDGYDVQWECKSDMDNAYRFGKIEVICEGYDHPDDEYILRGSCGLEYTIDLTKEGHQKQNHQHNYYGDSYGGGNSYSGGHKYKSQSSFGDWITLAIVAVIIYAVYKTCIETPVATGQADDGHGDGQGYWGGGGGGGGGGGSPPPPGFRPDYQSGSCGSGAGTQYQRQGGNAGGGGFWTGAATGGLLGYMFGNGGNRGYGGYGGYGGYARPRTGFGYASRPSYGGGFGSFGGGRSGGGSTGTRTASGFGGTRRR